MHNVFYASGFLYHPPTQQILLQQITIDNISSFSLFSGKGSGKDTPSMVFQKTIEEELKKKVPLTSINPIYDYFHKELQKNHFIQYATVIDIVLEKDVVKDNKAKWFSQKQLYKLKLPEQIKHDIIIAQRVIRAIEEPEEEKNNKDFI